MYKSSFLRRFVCDDGLSKNRGTADTGCDSVKRDWQR